jgi:hypothetical protein
MSLGGDPLDLRARALRRLAGAEEDETAFEFVDPDAEAVEAIRNYLEDIVGDGESGIADAP